MSSPDRPSRRAALLGLAALPLAIGGCSFTPLYGNGTTAKANRYAFATPTNRVEQIIAQELRAALGESTDPRAPLVTLSAAPSSARVGRTSGGSVGAAYEAIVSGTITVTDRATGTGTQFTESRSASTLYEVTSQAFADQTARQDAEEKAAVALADKFRLLLLGTGPLGGV